MKKLFVRCLYFLFLVSFLAACAAPTPTVPPKPAASPATALPAASAVPAASTSKDLILATTTSTRDSGLLDTLLPLFQTKTGINVKMVAVGTGQALKMGEEGNADVLLVHAPSSEVDYMNKGFGKERGLVMHNDYIIVGPASDPAKIKGVKSVTEALTRISTAKAIFGSRADASGTNTFELGIWKLAKLSPGKDDTWYLQTGSGMADTLRIVSEKEGYSITDRATYLAQKATLKLDIMVEGDSAMLNVYHVITVNPDKWPKTNYTGAKAFYDFMINADTQKVISTFGVDKYGSQLFFPDAHRTDKDLGL
jgi:tungstate transport system substrate-binding protein